jgi:DNA-binding NtrC family response regulator
VTRLGLVGDGPAMRSLRARIENAAAGTANVCIYGEVGTGKELAVRAIHAISDRRNDPLITFDCTSVPCDLVESELFGHVTDAVRGMGWSPRSPVGAIEDRQGAFSHADNGTLFIEPLCYLSAPLQAKLLRVIESGEFVNVGSTKPIRTNIRLVTGSDKDPKRAVDTGMLRADLYDRVTIVMVRVPPLRERREDIPLLIAHYVRRAAITFTKPILGVQGAAVQRLIDSPWPGNVRQLGNVLDNAVILANRDMLMERDLRL